MSGLFGSTTIKGTRMTDFSSTSAEVGNAIAFGYGAFPVDGFIGWAPLPPTEHRKVKRQGKGGVKQESFTYTLSYAVFFCKGPIYGFKWIKRNGKVVYTTDPKAPIGDKKYAAKWSSKVSFHFGLSNQLPDALIESYEGIGNVSSFPGTCYITVEDEDVTATGGAPPNYEACVIASLPDIYLTSQPYPNDMRVEGVNTAPILSSAQLKTLLVEEHPESTQVNSASVISGELKETLRNTTILPESVQVNSASVANGELISLLQEMSELPESTQVNSVSVISGELKEILRNTTIPVDTAQIRAVSVVSGKLES